MIIPQKIHYIWFGRGEKPELVERCINSWKKYMPDYEIIEWNEDNYEFETEYEKEAILSKKYAFVSDVARLKIVYEHGGIYLDTDVELVKPLTLLLQEGGFMGFERENTVNTGLGFAAPTKNSLIYKLWHSYESIHFINNGKIDSTACPIRNTKILEQSGLILNNTKQRIEDIIIYPQEYFCPLDYDSGKLNLTSKTYSIHHYGYSWADAESIRVLKLKRQIFRIFPKKIAKYVFGVVNKIIRWMR